MAVDNRHVPYAVLAGTGTLVGGITEQPIVTGVQVRRETPSGQVFPTHQAISEIKPGCRFTTMAIASALANFGLDVGKSIAAVSGGFALFAQLKVEGGTRAGNLSHRKFAAIAGMVVPRTLRMAHREDATLDYEGLFTSDNGTNDPLVVTDGITLPSGAVDSERFTLGPVKVGGITVPQVMSVEVDFGLNVVPEGSGSDIFDTFISIDNALPRITIRTNDIEAFKGAVTGIVPLGGLAASHANTSIYARKRAEGSTYVADGTAQHVKITCAGLAVIENAYDNSEAVMVVEAKDDGTNNPLIVNTASAIT